MRRIFATLVVLAAIGSSSLTACDGDKAPADNAANGEAGASTQPPQPQPITAVFTPGTFSTEYTVTIANPDNDHLDLVWSGPNCGPFASTTPASCEDASCTSKMTWKHEHPPCGIGTEHKDVTVYLSVTGKKSGRTIICSYQGANDGTGMACSAPGFDGSDVGPDNSAHVRYRLTPEKKCSKVQLIQVLYLVKKDAPGKNIVPHSDAMLDDQGSMTYQIPADTDDVNGFVVDKFEFMGITTNDPYYGGSMPGTPAMPATLDDKPGNTKPGYMSFYEVCAFCSEKAGDADFGKTYPDCFTWELDPDTMMAKKTMPQPPVKPSAGFSGAVSKWDSNHKFTMPAPPK